MARPASVITPLRILRERLGFAQKDFGALLLKRYGIAPETYRAYEAGRRKLPSEVADQLMLLTGADPDVLIRGTGPLRMLGGMRLQSRRRQRPYLKRKSVLD